MQPIQPVQQEIIGQTQTLDRSFFSNTDSYNGYIHAGQRQDQYMAALDRTYGGPSYVQLRYSRSLKAPSQPYRRSRRYPDPVRIPGYMQRAYPYTPSLSLRYS